MKKTIALALALFLSVCALAACGGNPGSGGETASASGTDVSEPAATQDPMAAVYEAMNQTAQAIRTAASTGRTDDGVDYAVLAEKGRALLEQYEALDAAGRARVDVTGVEEALENLNGSITEAGTAAAQYAQAFLTLHKEEQLTVTGVYCIKAVRRDAASYLFALTYQDQDGKARSCWAQTSVSSGMTAQWMIENAERMFAAEPVSETDDPIKNGNVAISLDALGALKP